MNAPKTIAILALSLLPAVASAQIIFEGVSDDDPNPVVKPTKGDDDDEAKDDEADEGNSEVDLGDEFSGAEEKAIREVLVKQLQSAHTRCLRSKQVLRPALANFSGTGTWAISADGQAKYTSGSATPGAPMFFANQKAFDAMPAAEREKAPERAATFYAGCLELGTAKVPVKDKKGEISLNYKVTWAGSKAVIEVIADPDDSVLEL